eukprot:TRINITY_DN44367_c0_g1_i10.p1 TRINITY_DN44367_c0_g1~~TRINITY_DN44367_c0_g1_i10.p1  ORF type:complete len:563 (-),score=73.23 TRINITY_DN44367_c0_g1_i10:215-1903(-)
MEQISVQNNQNQEQSVVSPKNNRILENKEVNIDQQKQVDVSGLNQDDENLQDGTNLQNFKKNQSSPKIGLIIENQNKLENNTCVTNINEEKSPQKDIFDIQNQQPQKNKSPKSKQQTPKTNSPSKNAGTTLTPALEQVTLSCEQKNQLLLTKSNTSQHVKTSDSQKDNSGKRKSQLSSKSLKITVSETPNEFKEYKNLSRRNSQLSSTPVPVKVESTPISIIYVKKVDENIENCSSLEQIQTFSTSAGKEIKQAKVDEKVGGQTLEMASDVRSDQQKLLLTPMSVEEDVQRVLRDIAQNAQVNQLETRNIEQAKQDQKVGNTDVVNDVEMTCMDDTQDEFGDEYRRTSMLDPMYKQENQLLKQEICELKQKAYEYYQWGESLATQINQRVDVRSKFETQVKQLKQQIEELERNCERQKQVFEQREQELARVKVQQEEQLQKKNLTVQQLEGEISSLQHALSTKDLIIEDLNQKIAGLHGDKKAIENQVTEVQNDMNKTEEKLGKYRALIYEFKEENRKFDERHQLESSKIKQLIAENDRHKQNLMTLQHCLKSSGIQPPLLK